MNSDLLQFDSATPPSGAILRQFVEKRTPSARCELCCAELPGEHEHLVEAASRSLVCACGSCAVLFAYQADAKYRRVPRRVERLPAPAPTDGAWNALDLPIDLAFLFHSSVADRIVAIYPSPAGPMESQLEFQFEGLGDNRLLKNVRELVPDVEALLLNRLRGRNLCYRTPIDECYRLVGLVRSHWRGISGGAELWQEVDRFFEALDRRAIQKASR